MVAREHEEVSLGETARGCSSSYRQVGNPFPCTCNKEVHLGAKGMHLCQEYNLSFWWFSPVVCVSFSSSGPRTFFTSYLAHSHYHHFRFLSPQFFPTWMCTGPGFTISSFLLIPKLSCYFLPLSPFFIITRMTKTQLGKPIETSRM